ncbi:D-alanyl-D-alanine carboxypeptidase family protein [Actinomarinicola tropica]|uniref:D-alanyl-D-alanine carboxypeptidase-like core domain-containing protein n=1 Tax=Actinomarinicola tropica TaxID=2789776 RepID=A0A5Q2RH39_9ACTN|nr:D-alanyl-D-alanine carboxypeptidase family protein [Actinomarinicola tropica]QGG96138.1 hypothetical protein GH723_14090 [Actinomarinicola tropica]
MSSVRTRRWRLILSGTLLVAALAPAVAGADRADDDRQALAERQRALVAELDFLEASDAELRSAIAVLDDYVALKTAEVAEAQDVYAQAYVTAEAARREEAATQAEVAQLEEQMAAMAVAAYVAPPQADRMETMLHAAAPSDAVSLEVYLDVQNRRDTDIVRQLREARGRLGDQRRDAEDAERRAETAQERAVQELADLVGARQEQADLHAAVQHRIGEASHETGLVALQLAQVNRGLVDGTRATGDVPLVDVRGFRVHRSIAPQVEGLLAAAEADGIHLGGGSHRTNEEQIRLRIAHCGGDDPYSVWERPAGECSPPTARPGSSLHELGLAIDFTYDGRTISSQDSPAFQWLAANAHLFGFHNLASEPWHWSVDGT